MNCRSNLSGNRELITLCICSSCVLLVSHAMETLVMFHKLCELTQENVKKEGMLALMKGTKSKWRERSPHVDGLEVPHKLERLCQPWKGNITKKAC